MLELVNLVDDSKMLSDIVMEAVYQAIDGLEKKVSCSCVVQYQL